jgi:hypothetical protein
MKLEALIEVNEDWYGNFKIASDQRYKGKKFVSVSFYNLPKESFFPMVCVWGNDDCGMEKLFDKSQVDDALALYKTIVSTPFPTKEYLTELGLVYA